MCLAAEPGLWDTGSSYPPGVPPVGPSPPEPELQKLPPEAGVAVPCLLQLCKQVLPEQAERAAPASPSLGFAGRPEKLGDMGQREVKVCASPVSSAIDPTGFFLGGGGEICFVFFA